MGVLALVADRPDRVVRVDQPAPARRRYGLFSAATVLTLPDGRWALGIEYQAGDWSVPSDVTEGWWRGPADCATQQLAAAELPPKGDTRGADSDWAAANTFTTYSVIECPGGPGSTTAAMTARVRALADWNEERQVEHTLWTGLYGNNQYLTHPATDDLTPAGGAVDMRRAVSLLAQGMHTDGGHIAGVLHMVPECWPYVPGVTREGAVLRTTLGDAVSFGAGYGQLGPKPDEATPGTAPGVDERWVIGSGPVVVRRGAQRVMDPVYDQDSAATYYLVERTYSVTIDGYVVAVLAQLAGNQSTS